MHKPRKLSVYERNQLLKYSLKETDLLTKGNLPVEYLTGFVNFAGLDLRVSQNVLIPRVETEELADLIIEFIKKYDKPLRYLEVGVGSGAISAAVFSALQKESELQLKQALLTDVSSQALELAKQNLNTFLGEQVLQRVVFLQSDLLASIKPQVFEVIVANLPYIPSGEITKLDTSVKDFEPHLALDGGQTGFELIAKLLEQVVDGKYLAPAGRIFLEVHESHTKDFIKKRFSQLLHHFVIQEKKDQYSRQRFLILQHR
jgi:release factor glutamine methyltransferase